MRSLGLTRQQKAFLMWAMFLALTGMLVKSCRNLQAPATSVSAPETRN